MILLKCNRQTLHLFNNYYNTCLIDTMTFGKTEHVVEVKPILTSRGLQVIPAGHGLLNFVTV